MKTSDEMEIDRLRADVAQSFRLWAFEHDSAQRALDCRDDAESLLALALSAGLAEADALRATLADRLESLRVWEQRAYALHAQASASAPPVVEVRRAVEIDDDWNVWSGDHLLAWHPVERQARFMSECIRDWLLDVWPPQVAAGGSWEGAIAWLEEQSRKMCDEGKHLHGEKARYWDNRRDSYEHAVRHFRTLSAPGAGGVGETTAQCIDRFGEIYKRDELLDEQAEVVAAMQATIATRDAEIGRLNAMVEQMVTRDHVLECVEAAVAEERANLDACQRTLEGVANACSKHAATIASMRPVVEAAVAYANDYALGEGDDVAALYDLRNAVRAYQARTAGGGGE